MKPVPRLTIEAARREFESDVVYLNTASLGLPPRRTLAALEWELQRWRSGRTAPADFDAPLQRCRQLYADLVGIDPSCVAVGSQVSAFVGLVAAALPDGSEVLTATGEFTSLLFPFLAQAHRGIRVREVLLRDLADAVTPGTALVAVSAVQSATGQLADLDALTAATTGTATRLLIDTTHAIGWLPVDASRFAYTVDTGYKWLLAPRGTCFFTVRPERMNDLVPLAANWYAGSEPWDSIYGSPLRLADDARRFDLSPVWHSWVGQLPALELLTEIGPAALHTHAVGLANRFRAALGLAPGDSAIVSLATTSGIEQRLAEAGIVASIRAKRLRLSFHLNNDVTDADNAAELLADFVLNDATT